MKEVLIIFAIFFGLFLLTSYCNSKKDPYEVGMHMDYSIICSDGYKYKKIQGGIIPCKNTDGTPLKCNQKRY